MFEMDIDFTRLTFELQIETNVLKDDKALTIHISYSNTYIITHVNSLISEWGTSSADKIFQVTITLSSLCFTNCNTCQCSLPHR